MTIDNYGVSRAKSRRSRCQVATIER